MGSPFRKSAFAMVKPVLKRGGGAMDPGASSCDAAVDVEMLLSEFGDDDTEKRKHALMPQKCELFSGRLEDGEMATAAETCGDVNT